MANVSRHQDSTPLHTGSNLPPSVPGGLTPPLNSSQHLQQSRDTRAASTGKVSFAEQSQSFTGSHRSVSSHNTAQIPNLTPSTSTVLTRELTDEEREEGAAILMGHQDRMNTLLNGLGRPTPIQPVPGHPAPIHPPQVPPSIAASNQAHQQRTTDFEQNPLAHLSHPSQSPRTAGPAPQPSSWAHTTPTPSRLPQQTAGAPLSNPRAPQSSPSSSSSASATSGASPTPGSTDSHVPPPLVDPHASSGSPANPPASGSTTPAHSTDPTNPTPAPGRIDPHTDDPAQKAKKSFWTAQKVSIIACVALVVIGAAISATGYGAIVGIPLIALGLGIGYYYNREQINGLLLAGGKGTVELGKAAGKGIAKGGKATVNAAIGLWDKISDRFDKDKTPTPDGSRHSSSSIDPSRSLQRDLPIDDDDDLDISAPPPNKDSTAALGSSRSSSSSIDPSTSLQRDLPIDDDVSVEDHRLTGELESNLNRQLAILQEQLQVLNQSLLSNNFSNNRDDIQREIEKLNLEISSRKIAIAQLEGLKNITKANVSNSGMNIESHLKQAINFYKHNFIRDKHKENPTLVKKFLDMGAKPEDPGKLSSDDREILENAQRMRNSQD